MSTEVYQENIRNLHGTVEPPYQKVKEMLEQLYKKLEGLGEKRFKEFKSQDTLRFPPFLNIVNNIRRCLAKAHGYIEQDRDKIKKRRFVNYGTLDDVFKELRKNVQICQEIYDSLYTHSKVEVEDLSYKKNIDEDDPDDLYVEELELNDIYKKLYLGIPKVLLPILTDAMDLMEELIVDRMSEILTDDIRTDIKNKGRDEEKKAMINRSTSKKALDFNKPLREQQDTKSNSEYMRREDRNLHRKNFFDLD